MERIGEKWLQEVLESDLADAGEFFAKKSDVASNAPEADDTDRINRSSSRLPPRPGRRRQLSLAHVSMEANLMRIELASKIACLAVTIAAIISQTGCGSGDGDVPAASLDSPPQAAADTSPAEGGAVQDPVQLVAADASTETPAILSEANMHPEVLISTDAGDIRVRLDAENAPLTTENFLSNYVYREFYPGTIFHYVQKDFIIAAGGYTADLQAKETRAYLKSEADNGLKNKRGTVAMTRLPDHIDSATSQFYINLVDNPDLDHKGDETPEEAGYCVFGEVVEGMDVAEKIAGSPVTDKDEFVSTPVEPIAIRSIELVR
jgi:cyclophilin family peptidyl-prolyl cis-trans isomerase